MTVIKFQKTAKNVTFAAANVEVLGAAWRAGISNGDTLTHFNPDVLPTNEESLAWDASTFDLINALPQATAVTIRFRRTKKLSSGRSSMFNKRYKRLMNYRDKERRRQRGEFRLAINRTIDDGMRTWDQVNWDLFESIAQETDTSAPAAPALPAAPAAFEEPVAPTLPAAPTVLDEETTLPAAPAALDEEPAAPAAPAALEEPAAPAVIDEDLGDVTVAVEEPTAHADQEDFGDVSDATNDALVTTEEPIAPAPPVAHADQEDLGAMSDATVALPDAHDGDLGDVSDATDVLSDAHADAEMESDGQEVHEFGYDANDQDEEMKDAEDAIVHAPVSTGFEDHHEPVYSPTRDMPAIEFVVENQPPIQHQDCDRHSNFGSVSTHVANTDREDISNRIMLCQAGGPLQSFEMVRSWDDFFTSEQEFFYGSYGDASCPTSSIRPLSSYAVKCTSAAYQDSTFRSLETVESSRSCLHPSLQARILVYDRLDQQRDLSVRLCQESEACFGCGVSRIFESQRSSYNGTCQGLQQGTPA